MSTFSGILSGVATCAISGVAIVALDKLFNAPAIASLAPALQDARTVSMYCSTLLVFCVLIRVAQTYLCAMVDYTEWIPDLFDLFLALISGSGLATVMALNLSPVPTGNPPFWMSLSLLGFFALAAHTRVRRKLVRKEVIHYGDQAAEIKLQTRNMMFMAWIAVFALVIGLSTLRVRSRGTVSLTFVNLTSWFAVWTGALVLLVSWESLRDTFSKPEVREKWFKEG